ncbi:YraN family protein [Alkaliphilus serpentinus]|uniref:UPF0102 protein F8153_04285 n=1 Tax=Alkaliphilus serpentinus TaxID=1482731 RepID=A0A833HPY1_9FIRM|nr:YraN family protein [Alkaliphilus serpentinus]KAB3531403.1 YraN family protein [Alkaliphilus serpentinus]
MKKSLGKDGEAFARSYLIREGYHILFNNYRTRFGEMDIIAKKGNLIVFVEVKTRTSTVYGQPRESINYKKQMNYQRLALHYVQNNPVAEADYRFDVIEIIKKGEEYSINHIMNAF